MAVVRIPVYPESRRNPIRYYDEAGQLRELPLLRLRADILVGPDPSTPSADRRPLFPATLDTGAPVSVFPRHAWQQFQPAITRLRAADERPLVGSVGGRRFTYFLGRVSVAVTDLFGRRLRAVPVLALFREDANPESESPAPVLLGLEGGVLDGRTLTRWPTVERYDPDITTLASHGQWWSLADP